MRAIQVTIDLVQPQPEYFDRSAMNDRGARLESEFFLTDQGLRRRCLVLSDTFAVTSDAGHVEAAPLNVRPKCYGRSKCYKC